MEEEIADLSKLDAPTVQKIEDEASQHDWPRRLVSLGVVAGILAALYASSYNDWRASLVFMGFATFCGVVWALLPNDSEIDQLRRFTRVFEQREDEVTAGDYRWVNIACSRWPQLQPRVAEYLDAENGLSVSALRLIWLEAQQYRIEARDKVNVEHRPNAPVAQAAERDRLIQKVAKQ